MMPFKRTVIMLHHIPTDLARWVAAEAIHTKSKKERELLNSSCDAIEAQI